METTKITVETTVNAPVEQAWKFWTEPEHITQWNAASEDWHSPSAMNDLKPGGKFSARMEARDGSTGFDFEGTYDEVKTHERIAYTMGDGRKVNVVFAANGDQTHIKETFDAEQTHSNEMQRAGWQSILDNFKKYAEGNC
jgi:uncharacterized protein YndB with AHSA1/START domain